MNRETFLLFNMLAPLVVGMAAVRISHRVEHVFDRLMFGNLLFVTPLLSILAFWGHALVFRDISLPAIGLLMMLLPGIIVWLVIHRKSIPNREKGSLLVSALFASRTTVGILSVYAFCGESGYSLARLVMMFGPAFFYVVGFPLANYYANSTQGTVDWKKLVLDPKMLPVAGLAVGVFLNLYGPERPVLASRVFPWLVAVNSWLFIIPVGMSMQVRGLGNYWLKALWFIPLRYLALPVLMFVFCLLCRLSVDALTVVMLLSISPVATGAVIMARIYKIDEKMVMAAYLLTTSFYLVAVVPVLLVLMHD